MGGSIVDPVRRAGPGPGIGPVIAMLLSAVAVAGCCTRDRVYHATTLPPELVAPETANVKTLSLAGLASISASSQQIERGDVLTVSIVSNLGEEELPPTPLRVSDAGHVNVPLIGPVELAGLELAQAEQAIASAAAVRGILAQPYVTVTMDEQRVNRIAVIGAVQKPQVHDLPRGSSNLLTALAFAGGLTAEAGPEVVIRRPGRRSGNMNLLPPNGPDFTADGGPQLTSYGETMAEPTTVRVNLATARLESPDGYYLEDGDVVEVPKRTPRLVRVIGLVKAPDEYEIPLGEDWYLLDALAKAGDRTYQVADKVLVLRRDPNTGDIVQIHASVREAKRSASANLRLQPGDIVSVEETPATFLVDSLSRYLRFGLTSSVPLF
jgi:polysaccharide export outer membrane protein